MKKTSLILLAALSLLLVSSVSAYVLLSPTRTWSSAPTYIVDNRGAASVSDSDGGVSATVNAINSNSAWNGAGAGTVVNAQAGNVNSWQLGDGTPMLNFRDPENVCTGSCLAATFTGFYQSVGGGNYEIVDADIVTNTAYSWTTLSEPDGCSNEFYLEGVQVHEIGHGLGLGHSNTNGATMFPSVSSCNNGPATIATDDANGINALYGGSGGGCTLGQKGDSCTANNQCCSGKCKGKPGSKTCK